MRLLAASTFAAIVTAMLGIEAFLTAGSWDLPRVWLLLITLGLIMTLALSVRRPPPPERDAFVPYASTGVMVTTVFVAALDLREGWMTPVPFWGSLICLLWFAVGLLLLTWAAAVNPSFTSRLRRDDVPAVVSSGPYAHVRHPGYAGMMLFMLTAGPAIGSWLGAIPGAIGALLVALRALHEDHVLRRTDVYAAYAGRVRRRLLRTSLLLGDTR